MDDFKIRKREYDHEYYIKNIEMVREKHRQHYLAHRDDYIRRNKLNYAKRMNRDTTPIPIKITKHVVVSFN